MEMTDNHTLEKNDFQYITLNKENVDKEHICCAFSDKKCSEGYELKKQWLNKEFENGYVFRRLDTRAKVIIEVQITNPNSNERFGFIAIR